MQKDEGKGEKTARERAKDEGADAEEEGELLQQVNGTNGRRVNMVGRS